MSILCVFKAPNNVYLVPYKPGDWSDLLYKTVRLRSVNSLVVNKLAIDRLDSRFYADPLYAPLRVRPKTANALAPSSIAFGQLRCLLENFFDFASQILISAFLIFLLTSSASVITFDCSYAALALKKQ